MSMSPLPPVPELVLTSVLSGPQNCSPSLLIREAQDFGKSSSHLPQSVLASSRLSRLSTLPRYKSVCVLGFPHVCREKAAGLAFVLEEWKPFTFGLTYFLRG